MVKSRATLDEVAKAAGVSVATVSKVLNDRADVSPDTRSRVQQQLRLLRYRPVKRANTAAGLIEVVITTWQHPYIMGVLEGISRAAQDAGIGIAIGHSGSDGEITPDVARVTAARRAGVVLLTVDAGQPAIGELLDSGIPVVVVDPLHRGQTPCITVGSTNFTGGVMATEHLIGLGHRRIAHAAGPEHTDHSQARLAGYASALRAADVALDESLITHSEFDYNSGRAVAAALLDRPDRPTAIFAASDEIAAGLLEEARLRGILVPQELSIVGFDNSFMAGRTTPPLTTIAQPLYEMGALATRSIIQAIEGTPIGTRHIELATELVVRDSAAPPG